MIKPLPFIIKCPQCGWSKTIYPKSDVMDMSWGIKYITCPQCGAETTRETNTESLTDVFKIVKNIFNK